MVAPKKRWRLWCRLCAKEDLHNIDLDEENIEGNLSSTFYNFIEKLFEIDMRVNDSLPTYICQDCHRYIISWKLFFERVKKIQEMFFAIQTLTFVDDDNLNIIRSNYKLNEANHAEDGIQYTNRSPLPPLDSELNIDELQSEKREDSELDIDESQSEQREEILLKNQASNSDYVDDRDITDFEENDEEFIDLKPCTEEVDILIDKSSEWYAEMKAESCDISDDDSIQPELPEVLDKEDTLKEEDFDQETVGSDDSWSTCQNKVLAKSSKTAKKPKKSHLKNQSNDKKFKCTECNRNFQYIQHLRQHLKRTHKKDISQPELKCDKCSLVLSNVANLKRHMQVHFPKEKLKVLPCPYCKKNFDTNIIVQTHIKREHPKEQPALCKKCNAACISIEALKEHWLTHKNYDPIECYICHNYFGNMTLLKRHMDVHTLNKYVCSKCGKMLKSLTTLRRHLLVHEESKPYQCEFCKASFKRSKTLKMHLLLHTGARLYVCEFCDLSYASASSCRVHQKLKHPDELAAQEAAGMSKIPTKTPHLKELIKISKKGEGLVPVRAVKKLDTTEDFTI